jgi:hypothetical protein
MSVIGAGYRSRTRSAAPLIRPRPARLRGTLSLESAGSASVVCLACLVSTMIDSPVVPVDDPDERGDPAGGWPLDLDGSYSVVRWRSERGWREDHWYGPGKPGVWTGR